MLFVEEEFEEVQPSMKKTQKERAPVKPIQELSRAEKKEKAKREKAKQKKGKKLVRSTLDVMQFRSVYNDQCFVTEDGGLVTLFQIKSTDIYSLNDQEIDHHIHQFMMFQRQFLSDYKIISMTFPVNTSEQQDYLNHVIKRTTNPNALHFLEQELERQMTLEKERLNKEYYLMIFAEDENELQDLMRQIRNYQSSFSLDALSLEKKKKILFKMANMNSKI